MRIQLQRRDEINPGCGNAHRAGRITVTPPRHHPSCRRHDQVRVRDWPTQDPIGEKGGKNLYGFNANDAANKFDLFGLKPALPCKIGRQTVTLTFDGLTLSGSGLSQAAVSGRPISETVTGTWRIDYGIGAVGGDYITKVFDYSAARQGIRNVGPTPVGSYWFDSCEGRSFWSGSIIQHGPFGSGAWGSYSWSLHPDAGTDTRGRSGFFIHGGTSWGSAGCIDLRYGDTALHNLMERVRKAMPNCCCYVTVIVQYSVPQASQTEMVTTWQTLPVY